MGDILIVRNLPAPNVVDVMISIARGIRDADGARLRTRYGVQPGVGPLTPSGAVNTGSDGEGAASPDSQASLPSQDELSRIDYCGNVIYDRGERRLLTDEGYVTFAADGTPQYHFYLRDHLGNIRVVFDQTGAVEQVTHYYPFGGVMRESTNPGLQPYKYGGKELDRTSGLDAYDFGARIYFADRMQWGQMDPLCEKYYDVSPYGYCGNYPVNAIDLHGDSITFVGNVDDINFAVAALNNYLGFDYVLVDGNGTLSQNMNVPSVPFAMMDEGQKHLYTMLRSCISFPGGMTTINLVNNSEDVLIGDALFGQIDIGDVRNINKYTKEKLPLNSAGVLSHELFEQYLIQQEGLGIPKAHKIASTNESRIVQSNIPTDRRTVDYKKGEMHVEAYTPYNSKLTHSIDIVFYRNNIKDISFHYCPKKFSHKVN